MVYFASGILGAEGEIPMNQTYRLLIALVAGVAIGGAAVSRSRVCHRET